MGNGAWGQVCLKGKVDGLHDVRMELIHIPRWSRAVGVVLSELDPAHHHQVQIAGIHRRGVRILTPGSDHGIESGDQLLALGAPEHLRAFKDWVNEEAGEEADGT